MRQNQIGSMSCRRLVRRPSTSRSNGATCSNSAPGRSRAEFFSRQLKITRPKRLIVDCWYSWRQMAAMLAASRLQIPCIDTQHGLQGVGHPGYSGWRRPIAASNAIFPSHFWVWGREDAGALKRGNAPENTENRITVIGNLWLNRWRDAPPSTGHRAVAGLMSRWRGEARVVLVTLQTGIDIDRALLDILQNSPANWHWFIRPRGGTREEHYALQQRMRAASSARIDVVAAAAKPLYSLFRAADWHVTGFSTCAVEALAFGVPTVLLHPSGADAFSSYLSSGVMVYRDGGKAAMDVLKQMKVDPSQCIRAAESAFHPNPPTLPPWEGEPGTLR